MGRLSLVVGVAEGMIGVLAILFAYAIYHNLFSIRENLKISQEYTLPLIVILFVFGFVSILSGLFLTGGKRK